MNKKRIATAVTMLGLLLAVPYGASEAASTVPISSDIFKDTAFREYVSSNYDKNKDGKLSQTEIENATTLTVWKTQTAIKSLDGIEYLTNLKEIHCDGKDIQVTSLNLSKNTALETLFLSQSPVKSVVLNSDKLTYLDASECDQLTNLDLSKETGLEELNLYECANITKLDLSKNTYLTIVNLDKTGITELDVSNNLFLEELDASNTDLATLKLGNNTSLTALSIAGTDVGGTLDLRKFRKLESLQISRTSNIKFVFLPNTKQKLSVYTKYVPGSLIIDARICSDYKVFDSKTDGTTEAYFVKSNDDLGWFRSTDYSDAFVKSEEYYWLEDSEETYTLQFHTGFLNDNGRIYYMNDDGKLTFDARKFGDNSYYFIRPDKNREQYLTFLDPVTKESLGRKTIASPKDVKKGEYAFGQAVVGWFGDVHLESDRKIMYYDENGHAAYGRQKIDGKEYCFVPATENTFFMSEPKNYSLIYVDECGESINYDGKEYRSNADGTLFKGWLTLDNGEKRAYYGDDYAKVTGFFRMDGKLYNSILLASDPWYEGMMTNLDGYIYCLNADKSLVTGLYIGKSNSEQKPKYYFNEDGVMQYRFIKLDGKLYYADPDLRGEFVKNGWFTVDGGKYYANGDCTLQTGINEHDDGYTYAFDENGKAYSDCFIDREEGRSYVRSSGYIQKGIFTLDSDEYYADENGILKTGIVPKTLFIQDQPYTEYYYYREDGRLFKDADSKYNYSIIEYEGNKYPVQKDTGKIVTNTWIRFEELVNGAWQIVETYHTNEKGQIQTGIIEVGGILYLFDDDGKLVKEEGFRKVGDKDVYVNLSGRVENSGWFTKEYKDRYAYPDGTVYLGSGWFKADGETYYLADDGVRQNGYQTIEGKKYFFGEDGIMRKSGWFKTPITYANGNNVRTEYQQMYYAEDGSMQTGWVTVDGEKYYFDEEGHILQGVKEVDGNTYVFDETGKVSVRGGWYTEAYEDNEELKPEWTYYFDEEGRRCSGLTKIGNDLYLLTEKGQNLNQSIWYASDDGKLYYFDENGKALTGSAVAEGTKYLFTETGEIANGLTEVNGEVYLYKLTFEDNKPVQTVKTGMQEVNGAKYYFDKNGKMVTGAVTVSGNNYYFETSGVNKGKMHKGWLTIGSAKYYYDAAGKRVTGDVAIDGKTYQFGTNGKLIGEKKPVVKKGWEKTSSAWYYYKDGKKVTGWQKLSNKWYYFDGKGVMQTGWKRLNKKWYYFSPSSKIKGQMLTGWQRISKKWYYFSKKSKDIGQMQLGWQRLNKKWYYFSKSSKSLGEMTLGWKKLGGKWYHFSKSSKTLGEMTIGWKKLGGKWYYFSKSSKDPGAMVTGWKKIDGKKYHFNKDGVCLNP